MRTQAFLRPPPMFLPPPLDARVLRVSLARRPRTEFVTVVLHAPAVIRLVVRIIKTVVRWVRLFSGWPRSDRPSAVYGARGPPWLA